jgi:hypothetical protein
MSIKDWTVVPSEKTFRRLTDAKYRYMFKFGLWENEQEMFEALRCLGII